MTAFSPEVAFGTKTRSSARAPTKSPSALARLAEQALGAAREEVHRVALELALPGLVGLEHGHGAGAVTAVVEEREIRVEQEIQGATVSRCAASSRA